MIITEIFYSIQGESTYSGLPCIFIRLAGCNLRCDWCDTEYSLNDHDGSEMSVDAILDHIKQYDCALVEITGGEPLKQGGTKILASRLIGDGYDVLLETNGTYSLDGLGKVVKIVDIKCPSSGEGGSFLMDNLKYLTPDDEVKFVMASRADFDFACDFVNTHLTGVVKVIFSPVEGRLTLKDLADWILSSAINVRLQTQLHKVIWGSERGR